MARRRVGYHVTRPGRREDDPPIEIPVAADLKSVPGTPTRDVEISYYSREYPLESVAVEHSASSLWALDVREEAAPDTADLYRQAPEGDPAGRRVAEVHRRHGADGAALPART